MIDIGMIFTGNTITTTSLNTAPGNNYFPGMEPPGSSTIDQQPDTYLHDMTPGPSLEPDVDHSAADPRDMDRY